MTINKHNHIQSTFITLTLSPAGIANNVHAWLRRWFFRPSEVVNKLAGQKPWTWLLILLKSWLGTWLSLSC